jgi:hypothetical protein
MAELIIPSVLALVKELNQFCSVYLKEVGEKAKKREYVKLASKI